MLFLNPITVMMLSIQWAFSDPNGYEEKWDICDAVTNNFILQPGYEEETHWYYTPSQEDCENIPF